MYIELFVCNSPLIYSYSRSFSESTLHWIAICNSPQF